MINKTELIIDRLKLKEANSSPEDVSNFLNMNWARVNDLAHFFNEILNNDIPDKVKLESFSNLKDMLNKYVTVEE